MPIIDADRVSAGLRLVVVVSAAAMTTLCSCSSSKSKECRALSGATLCLVKQTATLYTPEGSGLRPDSLLTVEIIAVGVPAGGGHLTADHGGRFPPSGQQPSGVVVPTGAGPVTITITATSTSGADVTARFSR